MLCHHAVPDSLESVPAPVSEKAPSMAAVLPLALVVMGLASAGITCLFWKCRRKKNRNWLDEGEGLGGADKQGWQASRNGDPTFQGASPSSRTDLPLPPPERPRELLHEAFPHVLRCSRIGKLCQLGQQDCPALCLSEIPAILHWVFWEVWCVSLSEMDLSFSPRVSISWG